LFNFVLINGFTWCTALEVYEDFLMSLAGSEEGHRSPGLGEQDLELGPPPGAGPDGGGG
jgi:hypothetical protein